MMISKVNSFNFKGQDNGALASSNAASQVLAKAQGFEDKYISSKDEDKAKVNIGLVGFSAASTLLAVISGKHKVMKGIFTALSLAADAALIKLNISALNNKKDANAPAAPAQEPTVQIGAPVEEQTAQDSAIADAEKILAGNENAASQPASEETTQNIMEQVILPAKAGTTQG